MEWSLGTCLKDSKSIRTEIQVVDDRSELNLGVTPTLSPTSSRDILMPGKSIRGSINKTTGV